MVDIPIPRSVLKSRKGKISAPFLKGNNVGVGPAGQIRVVREVHLCTDSTDGEKAGADDEAAVPDGEGAAAANGDEAPAPDGVESTVPE